jgi:hypothetical protein
MAETVTAVDCPAGEYTLIAEDVASVAFQWREDLPSAYGRWTFAASQPSDDIEDYWTLRPKQPANLNGLSVGVKVWAMPVGSDDLVMEVVTP